jgi:SagB-type dehydrogenase family enzyme
MGMKVRLSLFVLVTLFIARGMEGQRSGETVKLPEPVPSGRVSLETALNQRRSVRTFLGTSVSIRDVSQLLWACAGRRMDGVSGASRTYPSAGGIYPLKVYLIAGKVQTLGEGIYQYRPDPHELVLLKTGDYRRRLAAAAVGQQFVAEAPLCIVMTAQYRKTERVYGLRGQDRYVPMEAGHAAENLYLQAASLGMGTVAVGSFLDGRISTLLDLDDDEEPLYLLPVGWPR